MLFSFAITVAKLVVYALLINENDFTVCNKNLKNVSHHLFIVIQCVCRRYCYAEYQ